LVSAGRFHLEPSRKSVICWILASKSGLSAGSGTTKTRRESEIMTFLRVILAASFACLGASCASSPKTAGNHLAPKRICKVRTTAYTHTEPGGSRNAVGTRLSAKNVMSASADWSRWPLGTKFRIVDTDEVFQIDDYGSALIGTGTIDLYKTNRLAMRKWGVRSVDIDILEWGSTEKSLQVLAPRRGNPQVRRMIAALSNETVLHKF
jgi:3D (Asp-Asp-Asp) domain-containing protein